MIANANPNHIIDYNPSEVRRQQRLRTIQMKFKKSFTPRLPLSNSKVDAEGVAVGDFVTQFSSSKSKSFILSSVLPRSKSLQKLHDQIFQEET